MIYTTLKANRENGIKFVRLCEECIFPIGLAFGDDYISEDCESDLDKIYNDFTEKQIESKVLKYIKEDAKESDDPCFIRYGKYLFEADPYFIYDDLEDAIKKGLLIRSDLVKIEKILSKKGIKIEKEIQDKYGYWHQGSMSRLKNQYFPCSFDEDEECKNCHNCD